MKKHTQSSIELELIKELCGEIKTTEEYEPIYSPELDTDRALRLIVNHYARLERYKRRGK